MAAAKLIRLSLPEEAWVFSCSDIHLSSPNDENQRWVLQELTRRIHANFDKPGIVVLNGDILELWHPGSEFSKVVNAHQEFWKTLRDYAQAPLHRVVYVVGNHDGEVAWNDLAMTEIEKLTGAKVTLELELTLAASWSHKKIIFNHSHQLDADNAFVDQFDPNDFPFGKYVVQNIIPSVKKTSPSLFANIEHLIDRSNVGKLLWARVFYKYLAPLVVISAIILIACALIYSSFNLAIVGWQEFVLFVLMVSMVLILITIFLITFGVSLKLKKAPLAHFGNEAGYKFLAGTNAETIGYAAGHTHQPELRKVKNKLYANSGYGNIGLMHYSGRIGLPTGFATVRNVSWLELEVAKSQIEASVTVINQRLKVSLAERLLTKIPSRKPRTWQYTQNLQNTGGKS